MSYERRGRTTVRMQPTLAAFLEDLALVAQGEVFALRGSARLEAAQPGSFRFRIRVSIAIARGLERAKV
jgi:hypothetical protein